MSTMAIRMLVVLMVLEGCDEYDVDEDGSEDDVGR